MLPLSYFSNISTDCQAVVWPIDATADSRSSCLREHDKFCSARPSSILLRNFLSWGVTIFDFSHNSTRCHVHVSVWLFYVTADRRSTCSKDIRHRVVHANPQFFKKFPFVMCYHFHTFSHHSTGSLLSVWPLDVTADSRSTCPEDTINFVVHAHPQIF